MLWRWPGSPEPAADPCIHRFDAASLKRTVWRSTAADCPVGTSASWQQRNMDKSTRESCSDGVFPITGLVSPFVMSYATFVTLDARPANETVNTIIHITPGALSDPALLFGWPRVVTANRPQAP